MTARKWAFGLSGITLICALLIMSGVAHAQQSCPTWSSNYYNCLWWHNQLSQSQRDAAIVNQAYNDVIQQNHNGLSCKDYARDLVLRVSRNVVSLPSTCPNADGYYWCQDANTAPMAENWRNVIVGQIVQMNVRFIDGHIGPHTAVVARKDSSGVYFIDSNWYKTTDPNRVRFHYLSYIDLASVVTAYTVYDIR